MTSCCFCSFFFGYSSNLDSIIKSFILIIFIYDIYKQSVLYPKLYCDKSTYP